jgi:hypothetical protein
VVGATSRQSTNGFEPEILGIVPPSGTQVYRVDQAILDRLLGGYRSEIVYLCRACANDVLYPMWFKYFRSGPGGAGEAYHLGVFGKTGSGRSGLAKMMLCAYAPPTVGQPRDRSPRRILPGAFGARVGHQGLQLDKVVRG